LAAAAAAFQKAWLRPQMLDGVCAVGGVAESRDQVVVEMDVVELHVSGGVSSHVQKKRDRWNIPSTGGKSRLVASNSAPFLPRHTAHSHRPPSFHIGSTRAPRDHRTEKDHADLALWTFLSRVIGPTRHVTALRASKACGGVVEPRGSKFDSVGSILFLQSQVEGRAQFFFGTEPILLKRHQGS
jgi:hypothetical protein